MDIINKFPWIGKALVYLALIQSIIATSGSLYFSEVRHFTPCVLCWYQRILMYPLVLIISTGIIRKDKNVYAYVFPLSLFGGLVALYQVLLQNGVLPHSIAPCTLAASCETKYTGYFGFITIPIMSLTAFMVISLCMMVYRRIVNSTQPQ